jgi:hypothetical protein
LAQTVFPAGSALIVLDGIRGRDLWLQGAGGLPKTPVLAFSEELEEAIAAVENSSGVPAVLIVSAKLVSSFEDIHAIRDRIGKVPLVLVDDAPFADSVCEYANSCVLLADNPEERAEQLQFVLNYWLNVNRTADGKRA